MKKILIRGSMIRLGDLLKFAGLVTTGGEAKLLIAEGQITVNGEVCLQRGKQLVAGDKVSNGKETVEVTV